MKEQPFWFYEAVSPHLLQATAIRGILYAGKSRFQSIAVVETEQLGKVLVLDGKTQSAELDEFIYHEALVQPAMFSHPNPEKVFIAGGGEGAALREVLSHKSVKKAVMVDVDAEVVRVCRSLLPQWHQGSFDDPRVHLYYQDAKEFLAQHTESFDVMILDLPDPVEGGPAYLLYTRSFYQMVRQKLAPDGILALQAGPAGLHNYREVFSAVIHTLKTVFPQVLPYVASVPSFGGTWGFALASSRKKPLGLTSEEVDRAIHRRLSRELAFYDGITHTALFSLPKYLRSGLEEETRVITEENPLFMF